MTQNSGTRHFAALGLMLLFTLFCASFLVWRVREITTSKTEVVFGNPVLQGGYLGLLSAEGKSFKMKLPTNFTKETHVPFNPIPDFYRQEFKADQDVRDPFKVLLAYKSNDPNWEWKLFVFDCAGVDSLKEIKIAFPSNQPLLVINGQSYEPANTGLVEQSQIHFMNPYFGNGLKSWDKAAVLVQSSGVMATRDQPDHVPTGKVAIFSQTSLRYRELKPDLKGAVLTIHSLTGNTSTFVVPDTKGDPLWSFVDYPQGYEKGVRASITQLNGIKREFRDTFPPVTHITVSDTYGEPNLYFESSATEGQIEVEPDTIHLSHGLWVMRNRPFVITSRTGQQIWGRFKSSGYRNAPLNQRAVVKNTADLKGGFTVTVFYGKGKVSRFHPKTVESGTYMHLSFNITYCQTDKLVPVLSYASTSAWPKDWDAGKCRSSR